MRRTKAAIAAHMTAGAGIAERRQALLCDQVRLALAPRRLKILPLLGEWRMTLHAGGGLLRIIREKLPDQAGRKGPGVQ